MPLHIRGVNLFDFAQHPAVINLMQPAQELLFGVGMGDRDIAGHIRRILAKHPAILADIGDAEAFIKLLFRHVKGDFIGVQAQLFHHRHVVAHHPLTINFVLVDHAVGDGTGNEGAIGRLAKMTELGVTSAAGHQMGSVKTIDVITVPDNLGRHAATFRESN
ncbi:hypothetical protein D3C75_231300 [compost metagenome]